MTSIDQLEVVPDLSHLVKAEIKRHGLCDVIGAWPADVGSKLGLVMLTQSDLRIVMRRETRTWRHREIRKVDVSGDTVKLTPFAERALTLTWHHPEEIPRFHSDFRQARARSTGDTTGVGLDAPGGGIQMAVLTACTLVGGYGYDTLGLSGEYDLIFSETHVLVTPPASRDVLAQIEYDDVLAFRVDGPGAVTRGGGFMGGGLGLTGAVEGMVVASVLNALTTRTKSQTIIEVQDHSVDLIFCNTNVSPDAARLRLKPVEAKIRAATAARLSVPSDALNQLERLAKLHREGALTNDEFDLGKAAILAGL